MNSQLIGKKLMIVGLIGLILKLNEWLVVTRGCFGYNYFYEFITFGIPIVLLVIGFYFFERSV